MVSLEEVGGWEILGPAAIRLGDPELIPLPLDISVRICVTFPSLLWSQCFLELWKLLLDKAFLWESRVEYPGMYALIHLFILVNQREST